MDNHMIFRTVLIVLAAFVLFALINYYNNKQNTMKSEKFFEDTKYGSAPTASPTQAMMMMPSQPTQPALGVDPVLAQLQQKRDEEAVDHFTQDQNVAQASGVAPSEPQGNGDFRAVDFQNNKLPNDCFPRDRLTADDLLPKDAANSKWAQVNPAGQGDVKDQNFLSAGYMIGINTVGSSLKNANLQLRSEPVIPKVSVGPFLNSTFEPSDALRRPLEIGGDC
jgi:hypothetical protein